jgi:hypothetical protein
MAIPEFNELGYLPPGVYEANWREFLGFFQTDRENRSKGVVALDPRELLR